MSAIWFSQITLMPLVDSVSRKHVWIESIPEDGCRVAMEVAFVDQFVNQADDRTAEIGV